ncbi:hypothetical protein LSAT2_031692 [Lamellibrachia satsuma]|nr:hypothetical protein LSAT2_031692 [Lamellibrachia satsuma]
MRFARYRLTRCLPRSQTEERRSNKKWRWRIAQKEKDPSWQNRETGRKHSTSCIQNGKTRMSGNGSITRLLRSKRTDEPLVYLSPRRTRTVNLGLHTDERTIVAMPTLLNTFRKLKRKLIATVDENNRLEAKLPRESSTTPRDNATTPVKEAHALLKQQGLTPYAHRVKSFLPYTMTVKYVRMSTPSSKRTLFRAKSKGLTRVAKRRANTFQPKKTRNTRKLAALRVAGDIGTLLRRREDNSNMLPEKLDH